MKTLEQAIIDARMQRGAAIENIQELQIQLAEFRKKAKSFKGVLEELRDETILSPNHRVSIQDEIDQFDDLVNDVCHYFNNDIEIHEELRDEY
jgi:ABC-type transporter Mla subunit MlaD